MRFSCRWGFKLHSSVSCGTNRCSMVLWNNILPITIWCLNPEDCILFNLECFCLALSFRVVSSFSCFSNMFSWQTYNALFILRCITKFFVENLKEEDLVRQFEARPPRPPDGNTSSSINCFTPVIVNHLLLHELLTFLPCFCHSIFWIFWLIFRWLFILSYFVMCALSHVDMLSSHMHFCLS